MPCMGSSRERGDGLSNVGVHRKSFIAGISIISKNIERGKLYFDRRNARMEWNSDGFTGL
jgi:hypothetical protein